MLTFINFNHNNLIKKHLLTVTIATLMLTACNTVPNNVGAIPTTMNGINQPIPNNTNGYQNQNPRQYPINNYPIPQNRFDVSQDKDLQRIFQATPMPIVNNNQNLINTHGNIWDVIRQNKINSRPQNNPYVNAYKQEILNNKSYLHNASSRASRYLFHTVNQARLSGIPAEMALLPMIESSYDPFTANVNKGEVGLWQLTENTMSNYGYNTSPRFNPRLDIVLSTRIAYRDLLKFQRGFNSWDLAIAAKHIGEAAVYQAIQENRAKGIDTDIWSLNLPADTKAYVAKFWAIVEIVDNPAAHGVRLPAIANVPYFSEITAQPGMSLQVAANKVGVNLNELKYLNPGILQGNVISDPQNSILVPGGSNINPTSTQNIIYNSGSNYNASNTAILASENNQPQLKPFSQTKNSNIASSDDALKSDRTAQNNTQALPKIYNNNRVISEPAITQDDINQVGIHVDSEPTNNNQSNNNQSNNNQSNNNQSNNNQSNNNQSNNNQSNRPLTDSSNNNSIQAANKRPPIVLEPIPDSGYYIVKSGNTLIGTAVKFSLLPSKLAAFNGLKVTDNLIEGQKLLLVANKKDSSQHNQKSQHNQLLKDTNNVQQNHNSQGSRQAASSKVSYTVKSYDTLTKIARMANTTVPIIAKINNMSTKTSLQLGQQIYLPKTTESYKVIQNDSLYSIAKKNNITIEKLVKINNFSKDYSLRTGEYIKVPY